MASPRRVLVIEDNVNVGKVLTDALRDRGLDVIWAKTLRSARVAAAMPRGHDTIICDYELPDGKGTEFIDGYEGKATVILFSGVDRAREVEAECPNRKPDRIVGKENMGELVEMTAEPPCEFCKGEPVTNAASWLDGKPRPPAACPRCGKTAAVAEVTAGG